MASFFGEVIGLSSRAVEDCDSANRSVPKLQVNVAMNVDSQPNFVLFAVGKLAAAFAVSHFRATDAKIAISVKVIFPEKDVEDIGVNYKKPPKTVAQAYVNPQNGHSLICEIDDNVPEELNPYLFEALLNCCNSEAESVVLMSTHSSNYRTSDPCANDESFLRCLFTSKYQSKYSLLSIPYLTPPNIISKFPAAVLTGAEIRKRLALLVICYTGIPSVDSDTVGLFKEVLNIPLVKQRLSVNADASARLLSYLRKFNQPVDNLYV